MARSGSEEARAVKRGKTPRKAVFVVGAIFAALLLVCSGIALAAGEEAPEGPEQSEALSPPNPGEPGVEVEADRTATSNTFLLSDGQLETRLYQTPVNYRQPDGEWQPIDESFEELESGRLSNGPNSFDVSLPEHLGEEPVRLSEDGAWVSSELLGAEPEAVQPEETTASYESPTGGTSFEYANLADGLKEDIVIEGPAQPSTFHFDLDASTGLVPSLEDDGSILFRDANGRVIVTLPAPVMSDSADTPAESRAIHYELGPEIEGHWRLTVEADREWLTQPDRVWPAHLDPTMVVGPGRNCIIGGAKGQTGWIDCASWGRKDLLVDYTPQINSSEDSWQRGLIELETSALPDNASVSSATFNLYAAEAVLNTSGVELLKTSKPWTWEASWSQYAGPTHLWTTEGGDWSEVLGQVLTSQRGSQAGWWQFTLPAKTVEGEVAKNANLGTLLKLADDKSRVCGTESCTQRRALFSSSAVEETAKRPYLSVVYTVPAPPTVVAKAATLVKGTTATLNAGVNPNSAATTYQFEYGTTTAYGKVAPATAKEIGSGKTEVAVSEPLTGLSTNTTYHFRISATNSLGKTVGEDKTFTTLKLPSATTEAATGVKITEATLGASINPNGSATTYQFEYGPTTSYGTTSPTTPISVGSGTTPVAVTRLISGLTEASTYHFRVKASNEAGVAFGADKTLTTQDPPETTITSAKPTYTAGELSPVAFTSDQAGSTFKCSLDDPKEEAKTACTSPYKLPEHLSPDWHTVVVAAVSAVGVQDPTPAKYTFNPAIYPPAPATDKLISPETGKKTGNYYTLQAEWTKGADGSEVTGVTFQMQLPKWETFKAVPTKCVIDGKAKEVSWPLAATSNPGHTEPVFLKVKGCAPFAEAGYPEKEIKFRAVFDGSKNTAGASEPAATEFAWLYNGTRITTDATQSVGPASVDLLTGAFTASRTDVSIPVPGTESNLEFTRTYNSSWLTNERGIGGQWQVSQPMEAEYEGQAWTKLVEQVIPYSPPVFKEECWIEEGVEECEEWEEEEAQPEERWMELVSSEGGAVTFEIVKEGATERYVSPEYAKELTLTREDAEHIGLSDPSGTHTTFILNVGREYLPKAISFQATPTSARMVYTRTAVEEKLQLARIIAPAQSGIKCEDWTSTETAGCRTLVLEYQPDKVWAKPDYTPWREQLSSIRYYNATGNTTTSQKVAEYNYDIELRLTEEWDPRLPNQVEKYTYERYYYKEIFSQNLLKTLTPPGEAPWEFGYKTGTYGSGEPAKLTSVSRASLVESKPTATTTIAYEVPVSGEGAPYDLSLESVAEWGQGDFPVDATAIFPPSEVPAGEPPSDYSQATIHYLDPEGYEVNTVSLAPPGVEGDSIATMETDKHGNVVRSLSARNRLLALAAGASSAARSHELDSHSTYSADGTEMLESWGPLHKVRLESGELAEARAHTTTKYDEGAPELKAGETAPRLPTKETTAASVVGKGELEQKVSETHYNWKLRKPTETIVDPSGLNIHSITIYEEATGLPIETRQPKNSDGGGAGTTKVVYYKATGSGACEGVPQYANLLCRVEPAAQPGIAGQPELLVKRFTKYSLLDEPEEIVESPGGKEEAGKTRKTILTYDTAGRPLTSKIEGGGVPVPTTKTEYDPNTGKPISQRFVCESECGPAAAFQSAFGSKGTGNGQFEHPSDVAVDSAGNLWVVDKSNSRLEEFSENGEWSKTVGSSGTTGGKFNSPTGIVIESKGNVWVTDTGNTRVEEFNSKGEFVQTFGKEVNKTKVEAKGTEAEKNLCTAASGNTCQAGVAGSAEGQMKEPTGIGASSSGNLYVVETGNNRFEKFTPNGEHLNTIESAEGSALKEPTAIAVDSTGNLWVADTGNNRIREWSSTFTFLRNVGKEGTGNGEFKKPAAIEADSKGNVWVGDMTNNRVEEFSEAGGFLGKFGSAGSGAGQFSFSAPIGLAAESKGNLWVTDAGNNRLQKWTPTNAFDTQATTTTYDTLGRVTKYEDADGNVAQTTYDIDGRPVTHANNKGSQTLTYDPVSGVPTKLEDSAAGAFTASYDADGNMLERILPNGLTAKTTYNEADEPTKLAYTKAASCGESCTWFEEGLERSISGQILSASGTLASQQYSYDKAGRLKQAQETPKGGSCTTRLYSYDPDSNRTELTTRAPGIGGACATTGGTTQKYEYDSADRLLGTGLTYDNYGRITSLPAADAGGNALTTEYFSDDMVSKQTQNGITNTYELDAALRQRQRLQSGGLEGTEVFHYDGGSDSPAWTQLGSSWTRPITGIGGELAAIQESTGTTTFQLTNLHGNVVATASSSPTATKLLATFRSDEFGNPVAGSAGRFGWLGGKRRRTELSSGVIQMGVRSYVPAIGRFLTPDPIPGGSANAYDYANQDPVNGFDLEGTCSTKKKCAAARKKAAARVSSAVNRIRSQMQQVRENRMQKSASASVTHVGPIPIRLPWEEQVNGALEGAQHAVSSLFGESCRDAGGALGAAGSVAYATGKGLMGGTPGEQAVGKSLEGLGGVLGLIGTGFYIGHRAGVC